MTLTAFLEFIIGKDFMICFLYGCRWKILNFIKLFWRHVLFDLLAVNNFITKMSTNFTNIYDLQEKEQAFNTVPEMLRALGGEKFYEYTQQTTRQALENIGLNQLLIDELVTVVMRINYGQDVTLNGFASMFFTTFNIRVNL